MASLLSISSTVDNPLLFSLRSLLQTLNSVKYPHELSQPFGLTESQFASYRDLALLVWVSTQVGMADVTLLAEMNLDDVWKAMREGCVKVEKDVTGDIEAAVNEWEVEREVERDGDEVEIKKGKEQVLNELKEVIGRIEHDLEDLDDGETFDHVGLSGMVQA
ncbi:hypothetical protein B7494_g357 [Chlorociboria aeruginascens]|nr:hypothetical protein B7494_g357 [Chlorociboria aeruginascens]